MNFRTIRRLSILSAALLLFAAPAAHAQTPPAGDNHLTPVTVKLNASKTVKNVQYATLESATVEAVSCDADDSSDHSVWFQFMLPASANVDVDAGGSLLDTGTGTTTQVVMTLYHQFGLSLIETDCLFANRPRILGVNLTEGMHFVRLASDSPGLLQGPSQYRISVRVRYLAQFLADPEFDEPPGTAWKIKKAGNPPQVVRTCAAHCYVSFNGITGGKLQQTVLIDPSLMKFKVGDYFTARAGINGTPAGGSDVKMTVQLNYSDGTPPTKSSLTKLVIQTSTAATYSLAGDFAIEIKSKALKSIKIMIISPTAADTFRVLNGTLSLWAGSSVRTPLPVPPGP